MTTNMKNILLHRAYPGAFAAFAFLLIAPDTVQAQTPKQFFACYVPSSGVVYRIKEDGLKNACTGGKHVEFSWAQLLADVDGKVGIGTENPTVALDVVGDIRASGNLIIGNTIEINDVTNSITSTSGALSFGDENLATTGTVTAAAFVGDGSQLTNLPSAGGLTGLEYVTVNFTHTSGGFRTKGVVETEATCPTGKVVIGGSSQIEGVDTSGGEEMTLMGGAPVPATNAWKAQFFRSADRPTTVTVTAICAVG